MTELMRRRSELEATEVIVEGELTDVAECRRCGDRHGVVHGTMRCCCGEEHSPDICCACGHFHDGESCPQAPCGDYRCCIN
jgi:hypothetical protein